MMNNGNAVKDFIVENFLYGEAERLQEDTSFLGNGIIDSTGILELASFLEERYSVSIGDEELIPENLDSLNNIGRFLNRKLNGGFMESAPLESQAPALNLTDRPIRRS